MFAVDFCDGVTDMFCALLFFYIFMYFASLSELIYFLVFGLLNIVSCTIVVTCEAPWARGKVL